jgi:type IV secretory pathway VirB9-like protein
MVVIMQDSSQHMMQEQEDAFLVDARIKHIKYNPKQVVRVVSYTSIATTIVFSEGGKIIGSMFQDFWIVGTFCRGIITFT